MIQNRIRRKFKCGNLGCPYESVSFNKILSHTWDKHSLAKKFSFKCESLSCTKRYTNLQSFCRHVKSNHCWFIEQHMKHFNKKQAAAGETDLLINNPDIQEVNDLQQDELSEKPWKDLQERTNGLHTDESHAVNYFDLIANLLELRKKYNLRT